MCRDTRVANASSDLHRAYCRTSSMSSIIIPSIHPHGCRKVTVFLKPDLKGPGHRAGPPGLQIQQEVTEKTEGRIHLRCLRWLLFKTPPPHVHTERRT